MVNYINFNEEESEPEDFDKDGLFMLTTAAEQHIFRKNNARNLDECNFEKKKRQF